MAEVAKALILCFFFIFFGSASAQTIDSVPDIICQTSGYDVILYNQGSNVVAAGTQLKWSVPFARMEGSYTLDRALEPDQRAFLTGVLGSSFLGTGVQCEVSIN